MTDSVTGASVVGATLSIADSVNAGRTTTTDSAGNYTFNNLQQAGFTITVSASGYVPSSGGVTLTSSQSRAFQLVLITFGLIGRVTDGVSGVGVRNVAIQISDGVNSRGTTTDAGGGYNISGVRPGPYTVSAAAISYVSATTPITVSADTSSNFVLQRSCTAAPGTPEFLGWTSAGLPAGSVQLTWQPKNDPVAAYIVEVGTTVGGTDVAVIDTDSVATSYTLTGLRTSVNMYHARVRGRNACGVSPPSNEANPRIS